MSATAEPSDVECAEDRARSASAGSTFVGKLLQRASGAFQLCDLLIKRPNALVRQCARAWAIVRNVELDQLLDLRKREPRLLRLQNEPQPAQIERSVAAHLAVSRRRVEQTPPLVEADGLDAHAGSGGKRANCQRSNPLTLYHSTDAI